MATSSLVIDSDVIIDFLRRQSVTLLDALTHFSINSSQRSAISDHSPTLAAIRLFAIRPFAIR